MNTFTPSGRSLWLPVAAFILTCGLAVAGDLEDGAAAIEKGDYATARKLIPPIAQRGDRDGQRILGFMYMYELGVPRDYVRAYFWWSLAAAQGDSKSAEYRDVVSKLLTAAQLAEAKKKASDCKKRNFKGCT
jgi:TPR repeat protein